MTVFQRITDYDHHLLKSDFDLVIYFDLEFPGNADFRID